MFRCKMSALRNLIHTKTRLHSPLISIIIEYTSYLTDEMFEMFKPIRRSIELKRLYIGIKTVNFEFEYPGGPSFDLEYDESTLMCKFVYHIPDWTRDVCRNKIIYTPLVEIVNIEFEEMKEPVQSRDEGKHVQSKDKTKEPVQPRGKREPIQSKSKTPVVKPKSPSRSDSMNWRVKNVI